MFDALTKADLRETELRLHNYIERTHVEIKAAGLRLIKWMIGIILPQTALLIAIFALLK